MGLRAQRLQEPRVLTYRPHLKWMYRLYRAMAVFFGLAAAIFFAVVSAGGVGVGAAVVPVILVFLSVESWALARFVMRPLCESLITIFDDHLILTRMGTRIEIPFALIDRVIFSSIPYLGGWFTLKMSTGKKFKFTAVLERSDLLLDAIRAARPEVCTESQLYGYRRTAIYVDHSWTRFYGHCRRWPSLLLKYLVYPVGAAFLMASGGAPPQSGKAAVAAAGLMGYGFILYLVGEAVLAWRVRRRLLATPGRVERDVAGDGALLRGLNGFFYLSSALALTVLWLS